MVKITGLSMKMERTNIFNRFSISYFYFNYFSIKKLDHFLVRIAIAAGYLGDYEQIYDAVDKIAGTQDKNTTDLTPQANNYLNKWFSQFDGAIDVGDDGNVTIKADAMQGFRNALSDQVYSLGSYRLFTVLIWLRIDNRKTRIVFYFMHMPDPLMLMCKLALRAQTCTRIRWQYAFHNETDTNVLYHGIWHSGTGVNGTVV